MIKIEMTLAEWRELITPMVTEQIGNMSVAYPDLRNQTAELQMTFAVMRAERDAAIDKLRELQKSLDKAIESKDHRGRVIGEIRNILNTDSFNEAEFADKLKQIRKVVNNA